MFGAHVSKEDANKIKPNQIFLLNPKSSSREQIKGNFPNSYVHATYTTNPWSKNKSSWGLMIHQLRLVEKTKAKGLVVHFTNTPQDIIYERVIEASERFKPKRKVTLFLETPASKVGSEYRDPDIIGEICKNLNKIIKTKLKIGICIDTAHLWSGGIDIRNLDIMKDYLRKIKKYKQPLLIHLNDSKKSLGSGIDEHEVIAEGKIWKKDRTSLDYLINWIKRNKIHAIFEVKNNELAFRNLK